MLKIFSAGSNPAVSTIPRIRSVDASVRMFSIPGVFDPLNHNVRIDDGSASLVWDGVCVKYLEVYNKGYGFGTLERQGFAHIV